ncbi:neuropeptide FF receptor 2-like [Glandiceps talaboti]
METNGSDGVVGSRGGGGELDQKTLPDSATLSIFVVFFVFIFFGNIWVIIAVFRQPKLRKSSTCMFIISLSVSDIMVALFYIPSEVYRTVFRESFGNEALCRTLGWLNWVAPCATIFSLIGIGIDRYRAIVQPMRPKLTRRDAAVLIAIVWISSMVYSYHRLHVIEISKYTFPIVGFRGVF